ncbi:MAG: tRNA-dihydrouridine synthase [Rhodoferax sp.]|jgi:tRNA-dihydrouridine synthase C|uniref:tRNA dihydrouridine synthase n=1 Tax=Rhodoferax sp. TaxID=50421 RepID=UPI001B7B79B7|nr:tRNA-dihydrouridine synthase [Rhodoferax sp.]MBP9150616.1 tRNA-dihydrouridine synthase [Rhodoferax sp.]MBP9737828.1 tRNA-dihydrouridine synthase [Rhodoferax sp.]
MGMSTTLPKRLLLAPMEGLLDFVLRDILTRVGGVERCVSEFIRITDTLLSERVLARLMPELLHGSTTSSGVPVRPQLLGSDPACLADNAARLVTMGGAGIDLNFGCPSKVVNRHRGGAALLDEPDLLFQIVAAVRRAVPACLPVSAKMRLGLHDDLRAEECALAIEAGGASELVVHARTGQQAYRPPAYWGRVADIRQVVKIPLVANGEIWSVADAQACAMQTGCQTLMLGRGMVARPSLACEILADDAMVGSSEMDWAQVLPLIADFWQLVKLHLERRQQTGRLKQWLYLLQRTYPEAQRAFQIVRPWHDPALVDAWLRDSQASSVKSVSASISPRQA